MMYVQDKRLGTPYERAFARLSWLKDPALEKLQPGWEETAPLFDEERSAMGFIAEKALGDVRGYENFLRAGDDFGRFLRDGNREEGGAAEEFGADLTPRTQAVCSAPAPNPCPSDPKGRPDGDGYRAGRRFVRLVGGIYTDWLLTCDPANLHIDLGYEMCCEAHLSFARGLHDRARYAFGDKPWHNDSVDLPQSPRSPQSPEQGGMEEGVVDTMDAADHHHQLRIDEAEDMESDDGGGAERRFIGGRHMLRPLPEGQGQGLEDYEGEGEGGEHAIIDLFHEADSAIAGSGPSAYSAHVGHGEWETLPKAPPFLQSAAPPTSPSVTCEEADAQMFAEARARMDVRVAARLTRLGGGGGEGGDGGGGGGLGGGRRRRRRRRKQTQVC